MPYRLQYSTSQRHSHVNSLAYQLLCVKVPVATSKQVKQADGTARRGSQWDIPLILGKSKEGSDRNRIQCMVFDFVVHPDTCRMALNNARFKVRTLCRTACCGSA